MLRFGGGLTGIGAPFRYWPDNISPLSFLGVWHSTHMAKWSTMYFPRVIESLGWELYAMFRGSPEEIPLQEEYLYKSVS